MHRKHYQNVVDHMIYDSLHKLSRNQKGPFSVIPRANSPTPRRRRLRGGQRPCAPVRSLSRRRDLLWDTASLPLRTSTSLVARAFKELGNAVDAQVLRSVSEATALPIDRALPNLSMLRTDGAPDSYAVRASIGAQAAPPLVATTRTVRSNLSMTPPDKYSL